jgi:hypothetical protein
MFTSVGTAERAVRYPEDRRMFWAWEGLYGGKYCDHLDNQSY